MLSYHVQFVNHDTSAANKFYICWLVAYVCVNDGRITVYNRYNLVDLGAQDGIIFYVDIPDKPVDIESITKKRLRHPTLRNKTERHILSL